MDNRNIACAIAALVVGAGLIGAATASAAPPREATVVAKVDSSLQRTVSYADLNLAFRPAQQVLKTRIATTANDLCFDLNGYNDWSCSSFAIRSTKDQVAAAIDRAKLQMAGSPVGPSIAITMAIRGQ
jgi:UrcA family protein